MKKRPMAAALILPLVFIAPAKAQGPADVRSDTKAISGPTYVPAASTPTAYLPLRQRGSGVSVVARPIVEEDGSAGYRKTLVGSWSLDRAVKIGIGLIEVTRTSHKERALRRARPMSDTGGRSDRIAAIGLSFSF